MNYTTIVKIASSFDATNRLRLTTFLLLFVLSSPAAAQLQDKVGSNDVYSNPNLVERKATSDTMTKLPQTDPTKYGPFLSEYLNERTQSKMGEANSPKAQSLVRSNDKGKIHVYLTFDSIEEHLNTSLTNLGFEIEVESAKLKKMQGWISPDQIKYVADLPNVTRVSIPDYSYSKRGSVTSAGVKQLKANELTKLGYRGKGVRVGIVSTGANDWQTAAASGDLPARVTTYGSCTKRTANSSTENLCSLLEASCNEGTAMAEIVHDVAPDAELAIAAVGTSLEFITQIDRLITDFRADIVVDDLGFLGQPSFFDGDIATAIDNMSKKVLFVSSAGNDGYGHYRGNYTYSQDIAIDRVGGENLASYIHDFDPRASRDDGYHGFIIPANSAATVILKWDGRIGSFSTRHNFTLRLHDDTGEVIYKSDSVTTSDDDGIVGACIPNTGGRDELFFATVSISNAPAGTPFQMLFYGRGAIEYPYSPSSIYGHAALERVLTVGSINAERFNDNEVAYYSSQGPVLINQLNQFRSAVQRVHQRKKPDVIGVDGVLVTGAGGFSQTFFGTSASAPHIAGLAAQLMSISPFVTAENTHKALRLGARDIGPKGYDGKSGNGIADGLDSLEHVVLINPLPSIIMLLND